VEASGAVHLVKVGLGEEKLRLATEVDVTLRPAAVATATATAVTAAGTLRGSGGTATAHCGHREQMHLKLVMVQG
jgi:hypothetical protein